MRHAGAVVTVLPGPTSTLVHVCVEGVKSEGCLGVVSWSRAVRTADSRADPDMSIRELAVRGRHGVERRRTLRVRRLLAAAEPPSRKVPVRDAPVIGPVKPS